MAARASSSGQINTASGRSLITGKGGAARANGKMTETGTPNPKEGSSAVRLNGRMPQGDVGEQHFQEQKPIPNKSYADGTKQSFSPRDKSTVC